MQLEGVCSKDAGVDVVNVGAHPHRDFPRLRRNMVTDLNTDCSPRPCHLRQQWEQKRAVEVLDQLLVEWPACELAADNLVQQGLQMGSYRI